MTLHAISNILVGFAFSLYQRTNLFQCSDPIMLRLLLSQSLIIKVSKGLYKTPPSGVLAHRQKKQRFLLLQPFQPHIRHQDIIALWSAKREWQHSNSIKLQWNLPTYVVFSFIIRTSPLAYVYYVIITWSLKGVISTAFISSPPKFCFRANAVNQREPFFFQQLSLLRSYAQLHIKDTIHIFANYGISTTQVCLSGFLSCSSCCSR